MKFSEYRYLVLSDLYRVCGCIRKSTFLKMLVWGGAFEYIFWMRTCKYLKSAQVWRFFYPLARLILNRKKYKLGIDVHFSTEIGCGFYIGHFSGVVINNMAIIGRNCNISQGVTIGQVNRGTRAGVPVIGDNVYIGPGAKILGNIKIGNGVVIGANCVVVKDVPDMAVVVGVPAIIISNEGSIGYVNRIDYDRVIRK